MLKCSPLFDKANGPVLIEPRSANPTLVEAVVPELSQFKQQLDEHGALLFRNFKLHNTSDFDEFVAELSKSHLKYEYRSTPRNEVTSRVSTATNYPARLEIPMHCENSYQRRWPLMIAFCCIDAASEGGETPIADIDAVTQHLGDELLDKFEENEVEYVRHYHEGVDLPWQNVFQTGRKVDVERYCADNDIHCEWLEDDLLRTSNIAQGVAYHPRTKKKIFFNQAHLFHVSSLGQAQADAMISMFGKDRLPRHARFGNAREIPDEDLRRVSEAFRSHSLAFRWQPGDVLWLDNMRYAHGRRAFKGSRGVFAALMEPHS